MPKRVLSINRLGWILISAGVGSLVYFGFAYDVGGELVYGRGHDRFASPQKILNRKIGCLVGLVVAAVGAMRISSSQPEEQNPTAVPRMVDRVVWAYLAILAAFASATVVQCAMLGKTVFALQFAKNWTNTPINLKASLTISLTLIALSPAYSFAAALYQLEPDGSELKLRFQNFGLTIIGLFMVVIVMNVFQPGVLDGFIYGDWFDLLIHWIGQL